MSTSHDPSNAVAASATAAPRHRRNLKSSKSHELHRVDSASLFGPLLDSVRDEDGEESSWSHLVRTPLAFLSFLFSLSYLEWRDRRAGSWAWWGGEPWQRPDSKWDVAASSSGLVEGAGRGKRREEIRDALEMRGMVGFVVLGAVAFLIALGCLMARWGWRWWAG